MSKTMIDYADEVWNPITGCTKVSEGCRNCWAERFSKRLKIDFNEITVHQDRIDKPKFPCRPSRIFVCSMSDLFHECVDFDHIAGVYLWTRLKPKHTFLILTKRPARALEFYKWLPNNSNMNLVHKNLWFGVSVEDQKTADERIPILLQIPAAVRWVSAEPLLSDIDIEKCPMPTIEKRIGNGRTTIAKINYIDWLVTGGESGPGARPSHPDWFRSFRDQCKAAGVPFWFKQWGEWAPVHSMACNEKGNKGKLWHPFDPDTSVYRVGKKMIGKYLGRKLDGKVHNELP